MSAQTSRSRARGPHRYFPPWIGGRWHHTIFLERCINGTVEKCFLFCISCLKKMSSNAWQHKVSLKSERDLEQIHFDLSDFTSIFLVSLCIRLTQELSAKLRGKLLRPQDWLSKEVMCATFIVCVKLHKPTSHLYSKGKVLAMVTHTFWGARNDLKVRVLSCCRSKFKLCLTQLSLFLFLHVQCAFRESKLCVWNEVCNSRLVTPWIRFRRRWGFLHISPRGTTMFARNRMAPCVGTYFFKTNHWLNRIFLEQNADRRKHIYIIKASQSVVKFLAKTAYQKFTSQFRSKFTSTGTAIQHTGVGLIWASPPGAQLTVLTP